MYLWQISSLVVFCILVDPSHATDENAEDHGDHPPHWSYHGEYHPDKWVNLAKMCTGSNPRQSPINIDSSVTIFDDNLNQIDLIEKRSNHKEYEIVNNGHSVNIQIEHEVLVSGGDLPSKGYRIAGIHFHWGSTDKDGSEHTVSDNRFPLEMHMVTYDSERYPELGTDAVNGDNSLAVLGTMFKVSEEDNPVLKPLIDGLKRITSSGSKTTIRAFPVSNLLPEQTNKYFRYLGSLTTPPCAESVVWTMFLHTQTISSAQLKELRQLTEGHNADGSVLYIEDNYRPVQPIHKRVVYRSFIFKSEMSKPVGGKSAQEHSDASTPIMSVITILALLLANVI